MMSSVCQSIRSALDPLVALTDLVDAHGEQSECRPGPSRIPIARRVVFPDRHDDGDPRRMWPRAAVTAGLRDRSRSLHQLIGPFGPGAAHLDRRTPSARWRNMVRRWVSLHGAERGARGRALLRSPGAHVGMIRLTTCRARINRGLPLA